MSFFKITYNSKYGFATLHNYGCTFHCPVCSYKLRSGADGKPGFSYPKPEGYLSIKQIKSTLCKVEIKTLYFMGGEPTVARELPEMLDFGKNQLGVRTFLGHTNGSKLPLANLDGANVGLKAWDPQVHRSYTGHEKQAIYDNFSKAFESGMELRANTVFVPGLVDLDQIEAIAEWIGTMSRDIPFHIMGYIPVPGQPYKRPSEEQMKQAVNLCQRHLNKVALSHLSPDEALGLQKRDDRFDVKQIA